MKAPEIKASKIQEGCRVRLRCGGEVEVEEVIDRDTYGITFTVKGSSSCVYYHANGMYVRGHLSPFDIVEVIPPAFDWSTVKPGMAFRCDGGGRSFWYVGPSLSSPDSYEGITDVYTDSPNHSVRSGEFQYFIIWNRALMERVPENDIRRDS